MGRRSYEGKAVDAHRKRTLTALLMIILAGITLVLSTLFTDGTRYMIISLLVIAYTMVPFFIVYENRRPKAREIVLIAMMCALTCVAHLFFHVTVPVQIGTALVIIAGASMGPEAGFLVGTISRFICNFYMGQGPWTPWQMMCWGLLGFLAGLAFSRFAVANRFEEMSGTDSDGIAVERRGSTVFKVVMGPVICIIIALVIAYVSYLIWPGDDDTFLGWRIYAAGALGLLAGILLQRKRLPVDSVTLSLFTFFTAVIVYGGIMNMCAMFTASGIPGNEVSWNTMRLLYISGLPYDLTHGLLAGICMFVIGKPMIGKIERIKIKYGIYR